MRWAIRALLVAAAMLAYAGSLRGPFVLDDEVSILRNPSLRDLRALGEVLWPPPHVFTAGRPLLNLSFALNHAAGGFDVRGYHLVNLAIHVLGGLVFFGLLRRTLAWCGKAFPARDATPLAATAALLWTLHPLATAAVTYVSQRAESLMALCYLAAFYALVRSGETPSARAARLWQGATVGAIFAGTLVKETIVTAPVLLLLFDRALLAGSWREAWRQRRGVYVGLAASWVLLGGLMVASQVAQRGIGASHAIGPATYLLAEFRAVLGYARLALWPAPLVFDYGAEFYRAPAEATASAAALVLAGLAGAIVAWRRAPRVGFVALAFFILLAPTSSVVPIALQPMAESRALLPSAAIVLLAALLAHQLGGRRALRALLAAAAALALLTRTRNADYRSALALWTDSVAHWPDSSRARIHLGLALAASPATRPQAREHFLAALRLDPASPEALNALGMLLADSADATERDAAREHYEAALRQRPTFAEAHNNLANLLRHSPARLPEAIGHYATAVRLRPDNATFHANLALALARDPARRDAAWREFETALRLAPEDAATRQNYALALAAAPARVPEAIAQFEAALRLAPDDPEIHYGLANLLDTLPPRVDEAMRHYRRAIALRPTLAPAYNNLALLLAQRGELEEAISLLEAALGHAPDAADLRENLAHLRALRGSK
jgi:tetratricopeptide (TPR) repeat protein